MDWVSIGASLSPNTNAVGGKTMAGSSVSVFKHKAGTRMEGMFSLQWS